MLLIAALAAILCAVGAAVLGVAIYGGAQMLPNLLSEVAGISAGIAAAILVVDRITTTHQRRQWQAAQRAIIDETAITFVDVMRLLFMRHSEDALQANHHHYDYFVRLARWHLDEMRSYVERYAVVLEAELHSQVRAGR